MKHKLPTFARDEEAADWIDTHDTSEYMDELEEIHEPISVRRTSRAIDLQLNADCLKAIKRTAKRKGIPYQTLIQEWLIERLRQEAPDLISHR